MTYGGVGIRLLSHSHTRCQVGWDVLRRPYGTLSALQRRSVHGEEK
jgi:hypothetical protein